MAIYMWREGWTPGDNTVLYYSFNNDTASTSYDGVGNNNATWYNNSGSYENVVKGKCAIVDGTTTGSLKYLSIPTTFTFPTTNFTISFRTNFTQDSGTAEFNPSIFSKWNGSNSTNRYLFICNERGKIHVDIPYVAALFTSTNAINDGNWHLVVVTKSGSSYCLYIDLDAPLTATNSASLHGGSSTQALIGRNNNSSQTQWNGLNGKIDEFIVEDKARTAQERTDYYNLTKGNYGL